ncbi:MAG: hypothetical protein GY820_10885 [Gammaproteobacteria bacterium]|nr:hypothetical protein [Gammaproteobacteria bacterium]
MRKLDNVQQNQQNLEQNQRKTDSKLENFRSSVKTQGFRLSYEGGQIPQKDGECVQTNSDMGHSKSRASLGMHDIACECSECLLEKTTKIAQAKVRENFRIDASKNNRPNSGMSQQNVCMGNGVNNISVQDPKAQMQMRDFCEGAYHSNQFMGNNKLLQGPCVQQQNPDLYVAALTSNQSTNDDQPLRNLTAQQQNGQFSENVDNSVPPEVIEGGCCDSPSEHYFKKSVRQLTDYSLHDRSSMSCQEALPKVATVNPKSPAESDTSLINPDHNNRPNTSCYDIPSDFSNEYQQPSSELEKSLTNPDNSNRPNTNCNGVLQKGVHSETTAVVVGRGVCDGCD